MRALGWHRMVNIYTIKTLEFKICAKFAKRKKNAELVICVCFIFVTI